MGGLVQQPAALGAHRQHPAGRSRGTLLRHAGTTCHGGVTQTKWPPTNPGRFRRPLNTPSSSGGFLLIHVVLERPNMLDRSLEAEFEDYRKILPTNQARRAFDERIERLLSQHG